MHFACLSLLLSITELIWSSLHQRLTHILLSPCLITLFLSFWIIETYSPSQQDLPLFAPCEIWPGFLTDGQCLCCVSDRVCTIQVDVAWFYRNCLTDTCNCDRGGDCECLCTSIAAYAHKCCQQGVTIHWRSPSVCRELAHSIKEC